MISNDAFRKIALSFPETSEHPHFDRKAFRTKKRIFTTLLEKDRTANVKLSEVDQSVFCGIDSSIIYAVANKFGKRGWTTIELKTVTKTILLEVLTAAFKIAEH